MACNGTVFEYTVYFIAFSFALGRCVGQIASEGSVKALDPSFSWR